MPPKAPPDRPGARPNLGRIAAGAGKATQDPSPPPAVMPPARPVQPSPAPPPVPAAAIKPPPPVPEAPVPLDVRNLQKGIDQAIELGKGVNELKETVVAGASPPPGVTPAPSSSMSRAVDGYYRDPEQVPERARPLSEALLVEDEDGPDTGLLNQAKAAADANPVVAIVGGVLALLGGAWMLKRWSK